MSSSRLNFTDEETGTTKFSALSRQSANFWQRLELAAPGSQWERINKGPQMLKGSDMELLLAVRVEWEPFHPITGDTWAICQLISQEKNKKTKRNSEN
jgi:hypothetical protein